MATIYVDSIANLASFSGPSNNDIYYVNDPQSQGAFCFVSGSTITGNNVTIISHSLGCFFRIIDGYINVKWFGAMGDGNNDDTTLIQAALDYISKTAYSDIWSNVTGQNHNFGGGTLFFPAGMYLIKQTLRIGQHTRMLGVSRGGHFWPPNSLPDNSGTVILCDFENLNAWAIDAASYWTSNCVSPHTAGDPLEISEVVTGSEFDTGKVTNNCGIVIQDLVIDGNKYYDSNPNVLFGCIRLSASPNAVIRNVMTNHSKIGIMLSMSFASAIENVFVNAKWYGAVLCNSNSINLRSCYFRGSAGNDAGSYSPLTGNCSLDFINLVSPSYSAWGLEDSTNTDWVKTGKTGIFSYQVSSLCILTSVIELFTNGITSLKSETNIVSCEMEANAFYSITGGVDGQLTVNQVSMGTGNGYLASTCVGYGFYLGKNIFAEINNSGQWTLIANSQLYYDNVTTGRNIKFSATGYNKRIYMPDILFIDEGVNGQNYGAVYIDGTNGDDINYGFNSNDPIQTFDAALIRLQNQSTINPVKVIYIKAALPIGEGVTALDGAALKDGSVKSIQNVDVLITNYGVDETHPRGRIYFRGFTEEDEGIGQIELLGNTNLYFRNIDLICNSPTTYPPNPPNLSMFGLNNSYARLVFQSDSYDSSHIDINLDVPYNLLQANLYALTKSLIDIKFVNINISGGALSPIQAGSQNLGVECVAINSANGTAGWQDAQIISNNF